ASACQRHHRTAEPVVDFVMPHSPSATGSKWALYEKRRETDGYYPVNPIRNVHFESKTMLLRNSPFSWFGSRTTYLVVPTLITTSVRDTAGVPGGVTAAW